jgi:hypothetical protein
MDALKEYINKHKYLVVLSNGQTEIPSLFKSLREIGNNISIDYSTLSKKLKNQNACFCTCKETGEIFYIKKL